MEATAQVESGTTNMEAHTSMPAKASVPATVRILICAFLALSSFMLVFLFAVVFVQPKFAHLQESLDSQNARFLELSAALQVPAVPGVAPLMNGHGHFLLGISPDYPPYTKLSPTIVGDLNFPAKDLGGFSVEFARLMKPTCGIQVDFIMSPWSDCWTGASSTWRNDSGSFERASLADGIQGIKDQGDPVSTEYIGRGIMDGRVHGCTGYTHTKGSRNLALEFTASILGDLKTAGILTRLDANAKPVISPLLVDYTGVKLGDVSGWAPTADTFIFVGNSCNLNGDGQPTKFSKTDPIIAVTPDGNAAAVEALLDGTIDALYIYADQMYNFVQSGDPLAARFGTDFAYIHTGLSGWSINGTTLAISKRGSGLKQVLDPCIQKVIETPEYRQVCEAYFEPTTCVGGSGDPLFYDEPMNVKSDTKTCADGYCTCADLPSR